ncbi:MAG: Crp/Fnr family transcriptional regulator [Methylococcaceae bacterium]|nr:Crp/Fnr family transcriptional regulator [Methylococcaceae bacterium]
MRLIIVHLDILTCLKQIPPFAEVPEKVLASLAESATKRNFPKNSLIISEGDAAGPLFIILSGKVRVFLDSESGKSVTLSIQKSGSYFGELSLLDDEPRSASIITLEPTLCALIPKQVFAKWLLQHPEEAAFGVMRGLTRRVRTLTNNVRGLALNDVYTRLAKTLHELATVDNDELVIKDKISHQDLANHVGSSREMISKIMKDLSTGGYLSIQGRTIHILKPLPTAW